MMNNVNIKKLLFFFFPFLYKKVSYFDLKKYYQAADFDEIDSEFYNLVRSKYFENAQICVISNFGNYRSKLIKGSFFQISKKAILDELNKLFFIIKKDGAVVKNVILLHTHITKPFYTSKWVYTGSLSHSDILMSKLLSEQYCLPFEVRALSPLNVRFSYSV